MQLLNTERLIACREKLGISKREASKRMNMSQPAYLRYEAGQRQPSVHVIQTMAEVFSTSVDYLTGVSDDDSPNCYRVYQSEDPELFEIIHAYKNSEATKNRLTAYWHRFNSH